jgi:hypothetical protein
LYATRNKIYAACFTPQHNIICFIASKFVLVNSTGDLASICNQVVVVARSELALSREFIMNISPKDKKFGYTNFRACSLLYKFGMCLAPLDNQISLELVLTGKII